MIYYNPKILHSVLVAGQPIENAANRATGRSTAQALRAITTAMLHPGQAVWVIDHHRSAGHKFTAEDAKRTARTLERYVEMLNLNDMKVTIERMNGDELCAKLVNTFIVPAGPVTKTEHLIQ